MGKIVGVEIGNHSVKLAYISGKELKKAACVQLPDDLVRGGRILSMDAMADFLRDAAKAAGIPRAGAALTLSGEDVFTRDVTVPAMTERQLTYNLPYEFHDFLTEEKSKYFFDYSVRKIRKDGQGRPEAMELFACAMLKERVEAYRAMFRRAGFRLHTLTPVECAYEALLSGQPEADRCVVNLGHQRTRIHFFQGSWCAGQRELDFGLEALDQAIAREKGVDIHVAHSYKLSDFEGVLETDYARSFYSRLAVEIMKAINFYHYNNQDRQLAELYLCGGGAAVAPLRQAIAQTTGLTVLGGEALLPKALRPEQEPWLYLRAIGGAKEALGGSV